jgi:hypothetical protein
VVKGSQNILSTIVIYKKLPKINDHPTVENSPNLVTLVADTVWPKVDDLSSPLQGHKCKNS